jgi:hypothetical protein
MPTNTLEKAPVQEPHRYYAFRLPDWDAGLDQLDRALLERLGVTLFVDHGMEGSDVLVDERYQERGEIKNWARVAALLVSPSVVDDDEAWERLATKLSREMCGGVSMRVLNQSTYETWRAMLPSA